MTKASRNLSADQMIEELYKIFMPKQESSLARQEFRDYKQHQDEPALAYFANKLILFEEKGWPEETNLPFLLVTTQEDLCSRPVKRSLLDVAHTFKTYEQLKDRTMTLIAAQRKAIKYGLAYDTIMDGLSSTSPYHQTSQGSRGAPRTEMAIPTMSNQPSHWNLPGPMAPGGHRSLPGLRASRGQVGPMQFRPCQLPS
ncbi:MAG: hypothetical protein GY696_07540 [Gammaproteobacteria bacterium]|nr:hypothetical protein [Gammaproteobacteria bacterium]